MLKNEVEILNPSSILNSLVWEGNGLRLIFSYIFCNIHAAFSVYSDCLSFHSKFVTSGIFLGNNRVNSTFTQDLYQPPR